MLFSWNTIAPRFHPRLAKSWKPFCKKCLRKWTDHGTQEMAGKRGRFFTNTRPINEQLTGLILCVMTNKKLASKIGLLAWMATNKASKS